MRFGLNLWDEDWTGAWRTPDGPYWEVYRLFLGARIGRPYDDVLKEWCKECKPWRGSMKESPKRALDTALGLVPKRWLKGDEDVGWTGFGVGDKGEIVFKQSASYHTEFPMPVRGKIWPKWMVDFNKANLVVRPKIRELRRGQMHVCEGLAYVWDPTTRALIGNGPVEVGLVSAKRWDHIGKFKGWTKDLRYLFPKFMRVVPCGMKPEVIVKEDGFWRQEMFYYIMRKVCC